MTGHHGWALAFTDHQRDLAVAALTEQATRITQAARNSSGSAHMTALRYAQEYTALASAFQQTGPGTDGDVLVSLPRDKWVLLTGWILGAMGEDDYPWFVAEFLGAVYRLTGVDLPGDDR